MKALIFNSGIGSRMGRLTENCPKCLLKLENNESIFARQLRILYECGITEVIVTTGKYEHELMEESRTQPGMGVIFVNNPLYASTNYIYSMYLAGKYLDDDILMLHGDLVFDKELVAGILYDSRPSLCLINRHMSQPPKDFKGRIVNGDLREISVNIFEDNCYSLQPLYKLSRECVQSWLDEAGVLVKQGITDVYAENALNNIAHRIHIKEMSYEGYYINEIDTPEDYERVSREISMVDKGTYLGIYALKMLVKKYGVKRPFAIMGRHVKGSFADDFLGTPDVAAGRYFGVVENPNEESVRDAQQAFEEFGGDCLISIGGGSAIDTAKAVKYNLSGQPQYSGLIHIAVPTTAGSGSEATRFSVICRHGAKCSIDDPSLLPEHAVLDSRLLYSLGEQQRKVSLLDALCHSVESLMSRHSTNKSREYALYAMKTILEKYKDFAVGDLSVYDEILGASHYAGRAIDISKTTVGHAMSYTLTSDYQIQHGQAVGMCLIYVLRYAEGRQHYRAELEPLYQAMECKEGEGIADRLLAVYRDLSPEHPFDLSNADPDMLVKKVNADRLGNSVLAFDKKDLREIYADIIASPEWIRSK